MSLGTIIAGLVNNYCAQYIAQYATANLRLDLFKKIQTLSFANVDKFKTGRLITCNKRYAANKNIVYAYI